MTTCDEARSTLDRARERAAHEREVMSGYRERQRDLEYEHSDATRRWQDASALVVTNEREWDTARESLRGVIEAERAAEEKLAYWNDQQSRLRNGQSTDYSGENNEKAIIDGRRQDASDAEYNAEQATSAAKESVEEAKERFDRSKEFLQERADSKFAIEDKQSTLRNRIELQQSAVSEAEEWFRNAERTVNEVC